MSKKLIRSVRLLASCLWTITALAVGVMIDPANGRADDWETNLSPPSPPLAGIAQFLNDHGIYTTFRYTAQAAANPIGGQRQETDYIGRADFGATFDLGRLAHDQGGLIHFMIDDSHGRSLSAWALNSSLSVQNDNLGTNQQDWQVSILTYEQSLLNDRINFNVGRTDTAFLTTDLYCEFESHLSCGRPYGLAKVASASFTPMAIWGGRLTITPVGGWYGKVGIYQPNPSFQTPKSHGLDWSIRKADGYVLPIELGRSIRPAGAQTQNEFAVGALFSEAPYTQPFFSKKLPPENGRVALYGLAQRMLYQPLSGSPRGLYVFGYVLGGLDHEKQIENFEATAGLVYRSPFPDRVSDSARFMLGDLQYTHRYISYLKTTRKAEGGSETPFRDQIGMEWNYTYHAARWLDLLPNIQYIIHPDGLGSVKYPKSNLPNAFVLGLQVSVDLNSFIGGVASYPIRASFAN